MRLGRVVGTVVATRKDARLSGCKLLVVATLTPRLEPDGGYEVAVDTVQAGFRETVILCTGSSARMTERTKDAPVDAAIVGIVDTVSLD
ncbi:MAG: EutN/CcmL family microcompartment protein [Acidobacteriota bacterium]